VTATAKEHKNGNNLLAVMEQQHFIVSAQQC